MTYSKTFKTDVGVLAYHLPEDKVRLQVGIQSVDLDAQGRRELAEYLTKDLYPNAE